MKHFALLAVAILTFSSNGYCADESSSLMRIEVLLNKLSADRANMGDLRNGFDITPGKFILVGDHEHMYAVAWGGIHRIEGMPRFSAFAYTPDGLLMGIIRQELMYVDGSGSLKWLFALPSFDMGIAPGYKDKMFLFERSAKGNNGLYELLHGKKVRKLIESPEPIMAAAETGDGHILFAAGNILYSIALGEKLQILAVAPGKKRIVSFALDPDNGRVYISDDDNVFAVDGKRAFLLTSEAGGILRWVDGGLVVFDPKNSLLIRITGIAKERGAQSPVTH